MGLFSRLTAGIRARSRGVAGHAGTRDYPDQGYREVRFRVEEVIGSHQNLLGELVTQAKLLDACLRKLDHRAGEALRDLRYRQATEALYCKLLVSRRLAKLQSATGRISAEQAQLGYLLARLELKVSSFLAERQKLRSRLSAADADSRIAEVSKGLDEELAAISYSADRAAEGAVMARALCDGGASFLAEYCKAPWGRVTIPEKDREAVTRGLKALRTEVGRS